MTGARWWRLPIAGGACYVCPACAAGHGAAFGEGGGRTVAALDVLDACDDCGAYPSMPPGPVPGRVGLVADVVIVAVLFGGGLWLPEILAWVLSVGGVR